MKTNFVVVNRVVLSVWVQFRFKSVSPKMSDVIVAFDQRSGQVNGLLCGYIE